MDLIIEDYFRRGFANREILTLLEEVHDIKLSLRTLERKLQRNQLWRRRNKTDEAEVASFISQQLQTSGQQHGYRWMHQKCWMAGLITDRETVRQLMRLLDRNGVDLRAHNRLRRRIYVSRGPNYVWHVDGYDKLKPYGICVSGCIDVFSRKMIWLEAFKTNSDPRIIAGYFIDAVSENSGCPQRVRIDHGTENTHLAEMQRFLCNREDEDENGAECVTLGPSTGNQRIVRWWCTLRSECNQFWMDHFDQLKADGHFAGSFIDKSMIQFCFQNTIQVQYTKTYCLSLANFTLLAGLTNKQLHELLILTCRTERFRNPSFLLPFFLYLYHYRLFIALCVIFFVMCFCKLLEHPFKEGWISSFYSIPQRKMHLSALCHMLRIE